MSKISFTGRQYTVTLPIDLMSLLGWNKNTEVVISKYPGKDILFIERIRK